MARVKIYGLVIFILVLYSTIYYYYTTTLPLLSWTCHHGTCTPKRRVTKECALSRIMFGKTRGAAMADQLKGKSDSWQTTVIVSTSLQVTIKKLNYNCRSV